LTQEPRHFVADESTLVQSAFKLRANTHAVVRKHVYFNTRLEGSPGLRRAQYRHHKSKSRSFSLATAMRQEGRLPTPTTGEQGLDLRAHIAWLTRACLQRAAK